jgi:hypothetical protein
MNLYMPPSGAHEPLPLDERPLLLVLARVIDLGQGPPGLVSWARGRLSVWGAPGGTIEGACGALVLRRLARELVRLLPPDGGLGCSGEEHRQTFCGGCRDTLLDRT